MKSLFSAIVAVITSIGYVLTARFEKLAELWGMTPDVIKIRYKGIIDQKTNNVENYANAVAEINQQIQLTERELKTSIASQEQSNKLRLGAFTLLQDRVESLLKEGITKKEVKKHPDYVKYASQYKIHENRSRDLDERVAKLETELSNYKGKVDIHLANINKMKQEIENIKKESREAGADILANQAAEKIARMQANLSTDSSDKELAALRDMRDRSSARTRTIEQIAETDISRLQLELEQAAEASEIDKELDDLIFNNKQLLIGISEQIPAAIAHEQLPNVHKD